MRTGRCLQAWACSARWRAASLGAVEEIFRTHRASRTRRGRHERCRRPASPGPWHRATQHLTKCRKNATGHSSRKRPTKGPLFRPVNRLGKILDSRLTAQVALIVKKWHGRLASTRRRSPCAPGPPRRQPRPARANVRSEANGAPLGQRSAPLHSQRRALRRQRRRWHRPLNRGAERKMSYFAAWMPAAVHPLGAGTAALRTRQPSSSCGCRSVPRP